jgi:hypothetical protein
MRVLKKMSFDALVENISNEDKKNILGGSGSSSYGVTNGSYYDPNSYSYMNSTMNLIIGGNSTSYSSNSYSSSYSSGQGWTATTNGFKTSNKSEISRLLEFLTGQSNGQNNPNLRPDISQITSFISEEMKFATNNGVITLPNGTIWGVQLNNVDVYKSKDPRSPNYNPYAQWTINTVSGAFQDAGDSINGFGYSLTVTGIGAEVGIPISAVGALISKIGTGIEVGYGVYQIYRDINVGQNAEMISKEAAFYLIGRYVEKKFTNGFLGLTPQESELIKQTLGIELTVIQRSSKP